MFCLNWLRTLLQGTLMQSAKVWSLGCVNPASWLPLSEAHEFTQPRDHSVADPCISNQQTCCQPLHVDTWREACILATPPILFCHRHLRDKVLVGINVIHGWWSDCAKKIFRLSCHNPVKSSNFALDRQAVFYDRWREQMGPFWLQRITNNN